MNRARCKKTRDFIIWDGKKCNKIHKCNITVVYLVTLLRTW